MGRRKLGFGGLASTAAVRTRGDFGIIPSPLILDKNFNELYSNMDDDEKEIALLYAKGEYIEYATGRQFALVVRENEFCVLRYGRSKPQFKVTLWYGSIYYKFDYGTT